MSKIKGQSSFSTDKIIEALRETHGLVYLAAKRIGCTPKVIYNRAKEVAAVREAMEESRGELIDAAEAALMMAVAEKKEAWAIAFVLKTIGKNRGYVERAEVTGAEGGPIEVKIIWDDSTK